MVATTKKVARRRAASADVLKRNCTVSQWGSSLGIRIPREAAKKLRLAAGEQVSVEVAGDAITIRPVRRQRKRWDVAELVAGVTPAKVGGEFRWGKAVGKERL